MDAKKCDRYGIFYETPNVFLNTVSFRHVDVLSITLDLCPECYDTLASFLKNEQHDNSVKEDPLE